MYMPFPTFLRYCKFRKWIQVNKLSLSLAVILGEEIFCVIPLSFRLTTGWQSSLVEVDSVPVPATSDGESTPRVTWQTTWRRSRYSCTTTTALHSYKSGDRSQYTGHNQVSQHNRGHLLLWTSKSKYVFSLMATNLS